MNPTGTTGPKEPTRATVKRLFAVSGNRCAYPKCTTPLIDPKSGSVIGEICHIKGAKPGAARYDEQQTGDDRHGYANLVLLCNIHHKIIDDDEIAYTVDRVTQLKQQHEANHAGPPPVNEATIDHFVTVAISQCTIQGNVVTSYSQVGGQTANVINNSYFTQPQNEESKLEAKLDMSGDLELIQAIGCPGLRLTVICRSLRPAKIQSAHLLIDDVDVMSGFQQGFDADFGYKPLPGSTQVMDVKLIPLSRPNHQEGFILNRDDVARFYYPLPMPSTTLALRAKPENLSIVVELFDNSEQEVLTGTPIKESIESLYAVYHKRHGIVKVPMTVAVRVKSLTPPGPEMAEMVGKYNSKHMPIAKPDTQPSSSE